MIVNTSKNNKQHRRKITQGKILIEERNSMIEEQFKELWHDCSFNLEPSPPLLTSL